ncbi:hypothetical protein Y032_0088g2152 [Ancylostoma ceylanicum]|uniref:Uncharacterized protein n=1 Tax=Ancylostoma ceylanicum TaxID=53326 RepID=A0A016TMW4_9BILA|nr:hypothetical protein Y032_0088g2152 [Ancylostoma ceylanicum]
MVYLCLALYAPYESNSSPCKRTRLMIPDIFLLAYSALPALLLYHLNYCAATKRGRGGDVELDHEKSEESVMLRISGISYRCVPILEDSDG